jgi:penicillin-binding protein-related factor A (putative recombinase)
MPQKNYNTNLASEFYVLSMLHRLGVNCLLTLGNKKAVDILIELKKGKVVTIDVKGLKGTTIFPLDNFVTKSNSHYLALVSFLNKINKPDILPEVYILPSKKAEDLMYRNPKKTRKGIQLSRLRRDGKKYKDNWKVFLK